MGDKVLDIKIRLNPYLWSLAFVSVEKLFEERRQEHKSAVQALLAMQDYQKQHKMITLTLQRVFEVSETPICNNFA